MASLLVLAALPVAAAPGRIAPMALAQPADVAQRPASIVVVPECRKDAGGPQSMELGAGKSRLMSLSEPVARLTIGNDSVVHARLISPTSLYLNAATVGTTNMILQGQGGRCTMLDIVVRYDPAPLKATLETAMPDEKGIMVSTAGDSIVLSGVVSSAVAAQQIESLARSYAIRFARNLDAVGSGAGSGGGTSISLNSGSTRTNANNLVVNMLSITAPQQVMLEVKVAEVSKTLLDKLGTTFAAGRSNGWGSISLLTDIVTGTAAGTLNIFKPGSYQIGIEAEKKDGLVRILAEPNVMAISGQEGSFLAGGKILIPVAQTREAGGSTITLEEKEFGVGLKFTPTVLGDGRINLQVAPEVSELSRDGIGVTATGTFQGTAVLPLITTRRASTTVQLYDGQSFAIGGLIKSSTNGNVKAFPFLGEIPVLGALFRSTDFQSEKSELVFVVTPRLVKPLPPGYTLPTDKVGEPSRNRVMLEGRLDTAPPAPASVAPAAPAAGGMDVR
ncbi:type II and III secretion system protein family protein [Zoogloea sp.]|uniref:type II and III secretion system protein family protein n=1 Tax=Zoogloea sp. TaxID=49181 RepID=UPI0031FC7C13